MHKTQVKFVNLILISENYFLILIRNSNYKGLDFGQGYYDLPGGRMEDNETLIDSLRRELFEETSIEMDKINDLKLFCKYSIDFPEFTRINYYYKGYIQNKCEIHLSFEHKNYYWADYSRLEDFEMILSTHKNAIQKYKANY
ncbi:MAG: NUDIX hydrolase [Saprospiraceae bacterium]|nr:NUDIX hydrolase [Saprospiraceae bacterium]